MKIHFIGIGGIGVSALARYFLARGDEVSGSDAVASEIAAELKKLGAKIFIGHHKENLDSRFRGNDSFLDLVIYSAAVREDNPELVEARRLNVKTQKYAEALGELTKEKFTIAVSGMHGKSTTTAMIGLIMERAGLDPTVIVGTKVRWNSVNYNSPQPPLKLRGGENSKFFPAPLLQSGEGTGTSFTKDGENYSNFRAGKSQYLVIEADEYDRSFLNYRPKILVLLNIEEEHLDTYKGGLPEIMETFGEYAGHLSGDGVLIANEEDENIQKIFNFQFSTFNKNQKSKLQFKIENFNSKAVDGLNLKIPGKHNLSNANAALAVARVLGIDEKIAIEALNNFSGTWRRMEQKGEVNGAKIYDDYGHHPTEIKATLAGARELLEKIPPKPSFTKWGKNGDKPLAISHKRLWCVFQPHQYQRTYELFDQFVGAFGNADKVILLPIYNVAGRENEEIKQKVSSEKLVKTINSENVIYLDSFNSAAEYLKNNLREGDIAIIMGAGDVYKLTESLLE